MSALGRPTECQYPSYQEDLTANQEDLRRMWQESKPVVRYRFTKGPDPACVWGSEGKVLWRLLMCDINTQRKCISKFASEEINRKMFLIHMGTGRIVLEESRCIAAFSLLNCVITRSEWAGSTAQQMTLLFLWKKVYNRKFAYRVVCYIKRIRSRWQTTAWQSVTNSRSSENKIDNNASQLIVLV